MSADSTFQLQYPSEPLAEFVESFWALQNRSDQPKPLVILPDGRADVILIQSPDEPFRIVMSGLETVPSQAIFKPHATMCAISFKLLATEYILNESISPIIDYAKLLPDDFWDFSAGDLTNFESFVTKASGKIKSLISAIIDNRKRKLFQHIYAKKGEVNVSEISNQIGWSARQINRYFNDKFGLSLKTYCNILRFRASLGNIANGKLFPESNFSDQSHFIKEIKKFSGVVPKELFKNENDRFIQFSALTEE